MRRRSTSKSSPPLYVPTVGRVVALTLDDVDRVWRSQVEEQEGRRLVVLAPSRPRGPAILPEVGREVVVGWPSELGYLEAEATVASTEDGDFATWTLDVRRSAVSQRRSAYRLDVEVPVVLGTMGGDHVQATSRNLSEGGLACEVDGRHDIEEGGLVEARIVLPDGELAVGAQVVRSTRRVPSGHDVGLAFVRPDPEVAERLRQYVFEEQLARRSAGVR